MRWHPYIPPSFKRNDFSTCTFLYTAMYFIGYMEKHVHSILAKDFQRKKRKTHKPITNKNTHKHRQVTLHTNEKGKAGPWVPSLENWTLPNIYCKYGGKPLQYARTCDRHLIPITMTKIRVLIFVTSHWRILDVSQWATYSHMHLLFTGTNFGLSHCKVTTYGRTVA